MTALLIIIGIITVVIIMFSTDKKAAIRVNLAKGGLKQRFPIFVYYCENHVELGFELVKDDGEYLEYRAALFDEEVLKGYVHLGINLIMGVRLYNYFITKRGVKIAGFAQELRDKLQIAFVEPTVEEYEIRFNNLMSGLVNTKEFRNVVNDL